MSRVGLGLSPASSHTAPTNASILKGSVRERLGEVLYRQIMPSGGAPWEDRGWNNQEDWRRAAEAVVAEVRAIDLEFVPAYARTKISLLEVENARLRRQVLLYRGLRWLFRSTHART